MFGTYRFLLAIFVAVGHMKFLLPQYHIGASAVVCFYVLSGYVMTYSFSVNFDLDIKKIWKFYLDRSIRIYPSYLVLFCLIVIFFVSIDGNLIRINAYNLLSNILIVPLNFHLLYGDKNNVYMIYGDLLPIYPATSLALELQFYIVLPFLLLYRRLIYILFPISLIIFSLAANKVIDSYIYGYWLLPGTLFIFLTGVMLYGYVHGDFKSKKTLFYFRFAVVFLLLLLGYLAFSADKINSYHSFEVIIGFQVGLLATYVLSKIKGKSALDQFLGNLSYPIFLSHYFAIWIFQYLTLRAGIYLPKKGEIVIQIFLTLIMSTALFFLVDYKIQKLRKRIQRPRI